MVYDQQYLSIPGGSGNRVDTRSKSIRIKIEMQNSELVDAAILSAKIRLHNIQIKVMSFPYHKQPMIIRRPIYCGQCSLSEAKFRPLFECVIPGR